MWISVSIVQAERKANIKVGMCLKCSRTSKKFSVAHLPLVIEGKLYLLSILVCVCVCIYTRTGKSLI